MDSALANFWWSTMPWSWVAVPALSSIALVKYLAMQLLNVLRIFEQIRLLVTVEFVGQGWDANPIL